MWPSIFTLLVRQQMLEGRRKEENSRTYIASDLMAFSALMMLFFLFLSLMSEMVAMLEVLFLSNSSALSSSSASFWSNFSTCKQEVVEF